MRRRRSRRWLWARIHTLEFERECQRESVVALRQALDALQYPAK